MSRTYSNWARLGNKWTRYSVICVRNGRFEVGNEEKMKNTILIIPGNPGNDQFYVDFAADIGELWKRDCRIFIVSHLNHIPLPPGLSKLDNTQMSQRFNLEDQARHATEFVTEVVQPTMASKTLKVIGHSIGAFIGASIKPYLERDGYTIDLVGLFPTLINMGQTDAGIRVRPYVDFFARHDKLVRIFLWGLKWIPIEIKRFLARQYIRQPLTPSVNQAAAELIDSLVFRNITYMTSNELDVVKDLQPKMRVELSQGIVHLYYGLNDHWVPLSYADEMAALIGKDRVTLDDTGAEHAFVIKDSFNIADKKVRERHSGLPLPITMREETVQTDNMIIPERIRMIGIEYVLN